MVYLMSIPRELREEIFGYYLLFAVEDRRASNTRSTPPPMGPSATANDEVTAARRWLMNQFCLSHFDELVSLEVSIGGKHRNFLANDLAAAILPILLLNKQTHEEAIYMMATSFCFRLDEGSMSTQIRFLESASKNLLSQIRSIAVPTYHPCPCSQCGQVPSENVRPWSDEAQQCCFIHLRTKLPSLRRVYVPKICGWTDKNGMSVALEHWPRQLLAFKDLLKRVRIVPSKPEESPDRFEELNGLLRKGVEELDDGLPWAAVSPRPWNECENHIQNATNYVRAVKGEL
ncbi:MAG: hypothetical protein M1831_000856 [Alyxoria varia]|nr:MAG: hypothetical protein M1831_000856 [Alyxoria varia]